MGRTASQQPRKYQIMELWDRHHQILRLLALGHTEKQIAEELGCTTATVGNVKHGELGKRQLSILRSAADVATMDITEEIKRLAPVALMRIEEVLTSKTADEKIVFGAAKDILDRAGYGAPKIIQGQFTHAHLTKDEIEELKERARAIVAPSDGEVIDAEEE